VIWWHMPARRAVVGRCLVLALALAGLPPHALAGAPERLVFGGAGANLPIVRVLARAFEERHPGLRIEVPESIGTTGGVRAVADSAITVGLTARPLRDTEQRPWLTVVPYARTAQVLAVHPTVSADAIASAELVRIYAGEITRWRDGHHITVLTRDPGDSTTEVVSRHVPGFQEVYDAGRQSRRWRMLFSDRQMNLTLARTAYALGFADTGAVFLERVPVKALVLDGVAPTADNVASGRYPMVKTLSFVFRAETLPPDARAFVDFVRSPAGKRLIRASGYVPVD
jgi:phosphate transport system substrate-binding protein